MNGLVTVANSRRHRLDLKSTTKFLWDQERASFDQILFRLLYLGFRAISYQSGPENPVQIDYFRVACATRSPLRGLGTLHAPDKFD